MTLVEKLRAETRMSLHEVAWCQSEPHAKFIVEVLKRGAEHEAGYLPPSGNFAALSIYMGMLIVGWADRCGAKHNERAPFRITDLGREVLKRCQAEA